GGRGRAAPRRRHPGGVVGRRPGDRADPRRAGDHAGGGRPHRPPRRRVTPPGRGTSFAGVAHDRQHRPFTRVPAGHAGVMSEPGTQSTADLVKQAAEQISTLVRDELELARAEMTEKASRAGRGAGLFGGAGVVSLYGILGVLTGIVLLLARVMPAWGAALLVGVVL